MIMHGCECHCPEESSSSSSSSSSSTVSISTVGENCGGCNPIPRRWRVTVPAAGASTHTCHSTIAEQDFIIHFHTNILSICQYGSDVRYNIGDCTAPSGSGPCTLPSATVNQTNFLRLWVTQSGSLRQYLLEAHYHITSPADTDIIGQWKVLENITEDCFGDKSLADQLVTGCQHTWAGDPALLTVEP